MCVGIYSMNFMSVCVYRGRESKSYFQSLGKEQCFLVGVCRQTIPYFRKAAVRVEHFNIIIILIILRIIFTFESPIQCALVQTIYVKCIRIYIYINIILKTIRAHNAETTKYAFGVLNVPRTIQYLNLAVSH